MEQEFLNWGSWTNFTQIFFLFQILSEEQIKKGLQKRSAQPQNNFNRPALKKV